MTEPVSDAAARNRYFALVGARLVGPQPEAEIGQAEAIADLLDLGQVAPGFGAGFVQAFERCARQFELARRLQADRAVGAGHGDDLAAFQHRLPAEFGQRHQQVADAAGLVIRGGGVVGGAIDELLVLGADSPGFARLFPALHRGDKLIPALDERIVAI